MHRSQTWLALICAGCPWGAQMKNQKKKMISAVIASVMGALTALVTMSSQAWPVDPFDLAMGYEDAITNSISIRLTGADYTTYLHGKLEIGRAHV